MKKPRGLGSAESISLGNAGPVEREVKARVDDPEELALRIKSLGAKVIGKYDQLDTYFRTSNPDQALRLRLSEGKWTLTFKGPRKPGPIKEREEIECSISDGQAFARILKRLGMSSSVIVSKHRTIYRLDTLELSLDRVEDLGDFVEIEAKDATATNSILPLLSRLGISEEAVVWETYAELVSLRRKSDLSINKVS